MSKLILINENILGPIICFSSYSILFGYNSIEDIYNQYRYYKYCFFSITDINLFSGFQKAKDISNKLNTIFGITIKIKYLHYEGYMHIVFYCQQGYYNFLQIYNRQIRIKVKQNNFDENIVFNIDDFKHIQDNVGFYVLIGGTKSIVNAILISSEYHSDNDIFLNFKKYINVIFKNNIYWIVNDLIDDEIFLMNIVLKVVPKDRIIYNYPILHLDDTYYKQYAASPHVNIIAVSRHSKTTDVILEDSQYFNNIYCLIPQKKFLQKCIDANLFFSTYKFIQKLLNYRFVLDLNEHQKSYIVENAREKILNYTISRLVNMLLQKFQYDMSIEQKINIGTIYYRRFLLEIKAYDKITLTDIYSMLYVIHKIAIWCKDVKNNIALGPGRGSCVGSLIVYLLHITNLDPLEHGLLFERFINLERLSMPDIDIDICKEHRNDVLKQIGIMFKDENNEQNVIQIIIFLKFIFKMMIKDLLRVSNSNLKFMEINKILKIHDNKIALQEFLHEVECLYTSLIKLLQYTNLQNDIIREVFLYGISYRLYKLVNPYLIYKTHILQLLNINDEAKLFDVARFINNKFYELTQIMKNVDTYSNCIKTTGIHAAGILVGNKNFLSFIPLYFGSNATNDAVLCTHYDIEMLTDINAVKFDILGLGNLTIISSLTKILGIKFNEENIFNIMLTKNDISSRVYSMVKYGAVKNIFQIDKFHLISLCNRMKLEKFSDIVALNALNRPGTNQLAYSYISNKNKNSIFIENNVGTHVYKYTKESFGVIIYQEQIIQIAQSMANYTASQADVFRAIISKKKKNLLEIEKEKFITNCINNNVDMKDITKFYKTMEAFSGYAFNKSHSAAYSKITITTMFLKYAYYMQYNLLCIMHKYKNVQKIIEIMVECTLFTNIWYKLSNIYDSKYNTYSTNDNSKYVSFDDMQCCSMIRATIPSFIIKGISIQDLHILHTTNYKDIFNVIFNSQVSKSKLEILNLFNFFERVLNINKLYKQIDNLKQLTSNFKNTLYGFSNMNMNDNDYTESNFSLIYQDQQYINHVGFSLIRANIAFIIKKIFNNIAFQSNKFYTYIIYKIYEKQHSIMNLFDARKYNSIILSRTHYHIFDVILKTTNNNNIINITELFLQNNSLLFITSKIINLSHMFKIQYTCNNKVYLIKNIYDINLERLYKICNYSSNIKIVIIKKESLLFLF